MNGILIGIVTYNPEPTKLFKTLNSALNQDCPIIIIDNHSSNIDIWQKKIENYDNVRLLTNKRNYGIARALNQIFEWGEKQSYKWILTLDQDSVCPDNLVHELFKYTDNDKMAVIGATIRDINKNDSIIKKKGIKPVDNCITSGSLNKIAPWRHIGGFDEWMFIDGVDFDYCHRLRNAGYNVCVNQEVILTHEIGHIEIRKFMFWNVIVRNHSSFRKYYIVRNLIYLERKEHNGKVSFKSLIRCFKQLILVILYEKDKIKKIERIIYGIIDGIKAKI